MSVVSIHICVDCGGVWPNLESAEKCCAKYFCKHCNKELPKYHTICNDCRRQERYEKADKITEWDGWVYLDDMGYDDGFFESVDALIEYCIVTDTSIPKWAYTCVKERHLLDIDTALEMMVEEAFEGAFDYLVDREELIAFVNEWNKKQDIVSYWPNFNCAVLIEEHAILIGEGGRCDE